MGSGTGHTPGPWKFETSNWYGYSTLWNPETRQEVLVTGGRNDGDDPITWMGEDLSNADRAVIEAAPDLLAALHLIIPLARGYAPEGQTPTARATCDAWIAAAEAVLAKAEGK